MCATHVAHRRQLLVDEFIGLQNLNNHDILGKILYWVYNTNHEKLIRTINNAHYP